ncbi:hypothetical protein MiTe_04481 [Microcystis aeruginosa NIES-2520]|uniref:Uncharacterized protein n=1 Tax=Microcystis aeruginosa NIES-2520 TaxID=2303982 RepID=A0A5A5RRL7_MICAE|nr:hypothetical protein [Microcystis aeruginosa]NCR77528.1 hypothetical protein [Microcystis aeruginosa K13-06]GCA77625.1 hypothetical protein MiTe_04481 [Microcystis aeruginosa NIES-2520]
MNNRLCLHLMANKEKGFALPLAVLIGLILMVTGMTMIMRAQGDQSKVIAQKARADSLTSSEVGVARVQDLLNSVRVMAKFDSNSNCTTDGCWQNAEVVTNPSTDLRKDLKKLYTATACSNPGDPNAAATLEERIDELNDLSANEWIALGNNRYYRMVQYNFTASIDADRLGLGVLTLEGRSRTSGEIDLTQTGLDIDSDDNAASRNRVVVSIPILPSLPLAFARTTVPALWIREGATENAGQTGQITVGSADYSGGAQFQGDVVMSDTTTFDEPTATLQPELECFISTDKIEQPTTPLNTPYEAQFVDVPFPSLPPIPTSIPPGQENMVLTSSGTFPRPEDPLPPSGVYEYTVDYIDLSDDEEITINPGPGQQVVFYVKGNINGAIRHNCDGEAGCGPGNLQIYAYNLSGSDDPQICLRGDEELEAFIFAPAYSLGKTGTGDFFGAAWGRKWGKIPGCVSPDDDVAVTQRVEWTDLIQDLRPNPLNTLPQLGQIANWCEEPIDTPLDESDCD